MWLYYLIEILEVLIIANTEFLRRHGERGGNMARPLTRQTRLLKRRQKELERISIEGTRPGILDRPGFLRKFISTITGVPDPVFGREPFTTVNLSNLTRLEDQIKRIKLGLRQRTKISRTGIRG